MPSLDEDDNGCLGRVPGELVAAAIAQLTKPELAPERIDRATVHVPDLGQVRVTCVLRRDPRWKRPYWSPAAR